MKTSIFLFFCLLNVQGIAQPLNGIIIDSESDKPIAFVNIGVSGTKTGAYSKEDGSFELEFKPGYETKSLLISAIGYESQSISLSTLELKKLLEIKLVPKKYEFDEIAVSGNRIRLKRIGNRIIPFKKMAYAGGYEKDRIGKTLAIRVNLSEKIRKVKVEEVRVGIFENPWKVARFRCRAMSIDKNTGEPGETISNVDYIVEFTENSGWLEFDFSEEGFYINQNEFFVVFENVDSSGDPRKEDQIASLFPLFMFNTLTTKKQELYLSNASLSSWKRIIEDPVFEMKFYFEE